MIPFFDFTGMSKKDIILRLGAMTLVILLPGATIAIAAYYAVLSLLYRLFR